MVIMASSAMCYFHVPPAQHQSHSGQLQYNAFAAPHGSNTKEEGPLTWYIVECAVLTMLLLLPVCLQTASVC